MSDAGPRRIFARLILPALGGQPLDAWIEVDPSALLPAGAEPEVLTEAELRQRWACSSRTLKRLRDRAVLPCFKAGRRPTYRLADVRTVEAGTASRAARRGAR